MGCCCCADCTDMCGGTTFVDGVETSAPVDVVVSGMSCACDVPPQNPTCKWHCGTEGDVYNGTHTMTEQRGNLCQLLWYQDVDGGICNSSPTTIQFYFAMGVTHPTTSSWVITVTFGYSFYPGSSLTTPVTSWSVTIHCPPSTSTPQMLDSPITLTGGTPISPWSCWTLPSTIQIQCPEAGLMAPLSAQAVETPTPPTSTTTGKKSRTIKASRAAALAMQKAGVGITPALRPRPGCGKCGGK